MMYIKNLITVDPGKNGGVCWNDDAGIVQAARCPENDELKIIHLVKLIRSYVDVKTAQVFIEKQGPKPTDTPKTAFVLGANYYLWRMAFAGCRLPMTFITSMKWQKKTGVQLPPGRENYALRKKALKTYAMQGFPMGLPVWEWKENKFFHREGIITNANADAVAMLRALGSII